METRQALPSLMLLALVALAGCYEAAQRAFDACGAGGCGPELPDGAGDAQGLVRIEPGTFTMGSPSTELGRNRDEVPHQVTLTNPFRLSVSEVTQGEWQALMGNNPSVYKACSLACPVDSVSWWDAVAYANALSDKEGRQRCYRQLDCVGIPGDGAYACGDVTFVGLGCSGYRLPTEAEWEYAARAGTSGATWAGEVAVFFDVECHAETFLDPIAWYCSNSGNGPRPVGTTEIQTNPWGLADILGNVAEWVHDFYAVYSGDTVDPLGGDAGVTRAIRGGHWGQHPAFVRAAFRDGLRADARHEQLGFRLARTLP